MSIQKAHKAVLARKRKSSGAVATGAQFVKAFITGAAQFIKAIFA